MTTSLPLYYLCKLLNIYRSAKNDKLNGDMWFYNFQEYSNKSIEKQNVHLIFKTLKIWGV